MITSTSVCLVVLGALMVPTSWGLYRGEDCRAAYSCAEKGKQEVTNVIKSLVVTSSFSCMRQCLADSQCEAVNWRQTDGLCQLCSDTDVGTMLNDADFIHYSSTLCSVVAMDCNKVCSLPFQLVSGSCIWVSPTSNDWTTSRQACQDMGGDLAVVRSLQHADEIMDFVLQETSQVVVNIGCTFHDNTWEWVDGSTGIPNDDSFTVTGALATACVALMEPSPGLVSLNKVSCDISPQARYICEK